VSARLKNGAFLDIAKIEGSERYKAYMLGKYEESSADIISTKYCLFSQQICQQYWPMKRVLEPKSPLAPMIQALVAAADSTLDTSIHSIAVSTSDFSTINHELALRDVQAALNNVHVFNWNRLDHVARQVVPALDIQGRCSDPYVLPEDPSYHADPAQIILTIDFTRQSLAAAFWDEECGDVSQRRAIHSTILGYDALEECRKTVDDPKVCSERFTSSLFELLGKPNPEEVIGAVLILGEQANDDTMLVLLREALKRRFSNGEAVDFSRVREFTVDPAYAGSRASAWAEWEAKSTRDKEQENIAINDL
jgi:hypothetical protein